MVYNIFSTKKKNIKKIIQRYNLFPNNRTFDPRDLFSFTFHFCVGKRRNLFPSKSFFFIIYFWSWNLFFFSCFEDGIYIIFYVLYTCSMCISVKKDSSGKVEDEDWKNVIQFVKISLKVFSWEPIKCQLGHHNNWVIVFCVG